jgi:hypothetical protein
MLKTGNMKKNATPVLTFLFSLMIMVSCDTKNTTSHTSSSHQKYFADIDFFHLRGLNEMLEGERHYPYIRIDSLSKDEKRVEFFYDDDTYYDRTYKRRDSLWVSFNKVEDAGEGLTFHFYQFIAESRIVELEYAGDPAQDSSLVTFTVLEDNNISVYDFYQGVVKGKPGYILDHTDFLKKAFRKSLSRFEIESGILTYETRYLDVKTDKVVGEEKRCYVVNELSYFWWTFIGHKLDKTECTE